MSNYSKAQLLINAIKHLHEADALIQEALGATDECYDLHCSIEDLGETMHDMAEQLIEMQVTE